MKFLRFRLRTMFVFIALVATALAYVTNGYRQGQRQLDSIKTLFAEYDPPNFDIRQLEHVSSYDENGKRLNGWYRRSPPETAWNSYQDEVVCLSLSIKRSQLPDDRFQRILNAIRTFSKLKYVSLDCQGEFVPELFELATSHQLQVLSLENMCLTDDHAIEIAKLEHLESLNLAGNQITDQGLERLAKLLKLKSVDLSGNSLSGTNLSYLSHMKDLQRLKLRGNPIAIRGTSIELPPQFAMGVTLVALTEKGDLIDAVYMASNDPVTSVIFRMPGHLECMLVALWGDSDIIDVNSQNAYYLAFNETLGGTGFIEAGIQKNGLLTYMNGIEVEGPALFDPKLTEEIAKLIESSQGPKKTTEIVRY